MASVFGTTEMYILKVTQDSYLSLTYYLRGVNICVTTTGQNVCQSYSSVPGPNNPGIWDLVQDFYTAGFVNASLAMEGLVATSAAMSGLMTLSLFFLMATSPGGLTIALALRSLSSTDVSGHTCAPKSVRAPLTTVFCASTGPGAAKPPLLGRVPAPPLLPARAFDFFRGSRHHHSGCLSHAHARKSALMHTPAA